MDCRYCNYPLNRSTQELDFGKMPMTPNTIESGYLLNNDSFYEYEFKIVNCDNCGLIQQYNAPDPNILYFRFKNEIVGEKWRRHFQELAKFILNNYKKNFAVLEVGAGDLSLANTLRENGIVDLTVVEKNIDKNNIQPSIAIILSYLEDVDFPKKFDIVYSSHVFEHVTNIQQHIEKISKILNPHGKFIFSLPNFKNWIESFNLNAFSQEHVIYPLVENIETILSKYRLRVNKIIEFEDHSIFIESEISDNGYQLKNNRDVTKRLLVNFENNLEKFGQFINKKITDADRIYVFGGNSSSQILLRKFLKNKNIVCILDNAKIKQDKHLYGFNYVVKRPDVIKNEFDQRAIILIFTGTYIDEIKKQIMSINHNIRIITMMDFKSEILHETVKTVQN